MAESQSKKLDCAEEPESLPTTSTQFELNELNGDLFSSPQTDSLVHCVSKDLAMGKGIAVQFKKRFGQELALKNQKKDIGQVASLRIGLTSSDHKLQYRFVYYMITKARYFHKPTLNSMETTLKYLRDQAIRDGVQVLSMPTIGCGLDGLKWPDVKDLLIQVFGNTSIKINVYRM